VDSLDPNLSLVTGGEFSRKVIPEYLFLQEDFSLELALVVSMPLSQQHASSGGKEKERRRRRRRRREDNKRVRRR